MVNLAKRRAEQQQHFSMIEDRNVTILLPQDNLKQTAKVADLTETEEASDKEQCELGLLAELWRKRMARDDVAKFETSAAKKLRLLRASKVYPYVLLRVRLPRGVFLQARFNSGESLEVRVETIFLFHHPGCCSENETETYYYII